MAMNLYLRGKDCFKTNDLTIFGKLMSQNLNLGINSYWDPNYLNEHEKSVGALANCTHIEGPLEWSLRKSTLMYWEGAYLHHYAKEGFDDFE